MKLYYVNGEEAPYLSRLDEAKKLARHAARDSYDDIDVQLVEIDTTKANVLRMLNNSGGTTRFLDIVFTAKAKKGSK